MNSLRKILLFMLLVLFVLMQARASGPLDFSVLNPDHKVVPICFQNGAFWFQNIKLPVIVLANPSSSVTTVETLAIIGMAENREVIRLTLSASTIEAGAATAAKLLNQLLTDKQKEYFLNAWFGSVPPLKKTLVAGPRLDKDDQLALDLFKITPLVYAGPLKLDGLQIEISGRQGEKPFSQHESLLLTPYTSRGSYQFPLKGRLTVSSLPLGYSHRGAQAQEFAIDIMDIRRLENGEFSTSTCAARGENMVIQLSNQVNDYHIFNREVLAAADGIVCDVGNGFPDELAIDPTEDFMERIEKLSPSLLSNGLSMRHIRNGNYVIIDHQNGEYSMNCHLRQSIPVKVGDRVKQGQCIGLVGNTGLSMEPHLHFQLMDAADPARANGLPILFSDLPLGTALDSPFFGERNSVLYSEFIFMFVK